MTLPKEISDEISRIQRMYFEPGKVMEPLIPHITLLNPGLLTTISPLHMIPKIQEIADKMLPLLINLEATDMFYDRVLYISVYSPVLVSLQAKLYQLLPEKVRAEALGRDYTPHVTIVQSKPKQNLAPDTAKEYVSQIQLLLPYIFSAEYLTQFTWRGPRQYELKRI